MRAKGPGPGKLKLQNELLKSAFSSSLSKIVF